MTQHRSRVTSTEPPPPSASASATDFKVKHSPWVEFEGVRMSLASEFFIRQMKQDVTEMRKRRLGM